jgi:hypothetical protein
MPLLDNQVLDRMLVAGRPRLEGAHEGFMRRAEFLPPRDKLLLELTLEKQLTRRQIGLMLGVPPGTVTRRLQRLSRRLYDPIVIALTAPGCSLPADHRQIGIEHFLHGRRIARIALDHQMSKARVCEMLAYIRGWERGRRR